MICSHLTSSPMQASKVVRDRSRVFAEDDLHIPEELQARRHTVLSPLNVEIGRRIFYTVSLEFFLVEIETT
jgi:hypothetical protein